MWGDDHGNQGSLETAREVPSLVRGSGAENNRFFLLVGTELSKAECLSGPGPTEREMFVSLNPSLVSYDRVLYKSLAAEKEPQPRSDINNVVMSKLGSKPGKTPLYRGMWALTVSQLSVQTCAMKLLASRRFQVLPLAYMQEIRHSNQLGSPAIRLVLVIQSHRCHDRQHQDRQQQRWRPWHRLL